MDRHFLFSKFPLRSAAWLPCGEEHRPQCCGTGWCSWWDPKTSHRSLSWLVLILHTERHDTAGCEGQRRGVCACEDTCGRVCVNMHVHPCLSVCRNRMVSVCECVCKWASKCMYREIYMYLKCKDYFSFFKDFIYLFVRDTERGRHR